MPIQTDFLGSKLCFRYFKVVETLNFIKKREVMNLSLLKNRRLNEAWFYAFPTFMD